eukprot:2402704-Amphidinium_carterae.3
MTDFPQLHSKWNQLCVCSAVLPMWYIKIYETIVSSCSNPSKSRNARVCRDMPMRTASVTAPRSHSQGREVSLQLLDQFLGTAWKSLLCGVNHPQTQCAIFDAVLALNVVGIPLSTGRCPMHTCLRSPRTTGRLYTIIVPNFQVANPVRCKKGDGAAAHASSALFANSKLS